MTGAKDGKLFRPDHLTGIHHFLHPGSVNRGPSGNNLSIFDGFGLDHPHDRMIASDYSGQRY